ncbi:MAG: signal peptidase II, partial [Ktedonobacterales bacterium]
MSPARRNDIVMVAAGVFVVLADQLTKHWITQYFTTGAPKDPIALIGPYLQLIYDQNTGVAFSLLAGQTVLFLFIACAIAVVGYLYWRMRASGSLLLKLTFGLILGGALGNLIDRFSHQYVVDFVHFQIPGRFDYP